MARKAKPPLPAPSGSHLQPSLVLLSKLGSIAVHVDEFLSSNGHWFDRAALQQLLTDHEVRDWLRAMGPLVPEKRTKGSS